jgi:hypothetical protein
MGCGCGNGQPQELWEPVFSDRTVGAPTSKTDATRQVSEKGGYIREAVTASASK